MRDEGPVLDTLDMVLGIFMPGLMTVDPNLMNPGGTGIPQAQGPRNTRRPLEKRPGP